MAAAVLIELRRVDDQASRLVLLLLASKLRPAVVVVVAMVMMLGEAKSLLNKLEFDLMRASLDVDDAWDITRHLSAACFCFSLSLSQCCFVCLLIKKRS